MATIGSLSCVFWVVGGMEMVERLAYYGVRAAAMIYFYGRWILKLARKEMRPD